MQGRMIDVIAREIIVLDVLGQKTVDCRWACSYTKIQRVLFRHAQAPSDNDIFKSREDLYACITHGILYAEMF